MVRNAADHGIEAADLRKAAGKSRTGTVRVTATETTDHVFLSISDDGKGIDYDAIRAKAESIGLLSSDKELTSDEITEILFAPGVSTAAKVSDVSGRGVGMDVVKSAVDALGGGISVTSSPGGGSQFQIHMPKSINTQIVSGLVVAVADGTYVIPIQKVQECFCPAHEEIHRVLRTGECVIRHGKSLPLLRLHSLFAGQPVEEQTVNDGVMVAVESRRKQFAICVDQVIGVQQVVLKKVAGLQTESEIFTGGALMGDGRTAMFLDLDAICACAAERDTDR